MQCNNISASCALVLGVSLFAGCNPADYVKQQATTGVNRVKDATVELVNQEVVELKQKLQLLENEKLELKRQVEEQKKALEMNLKAESDAIRQLYVD